MFKDTKMELLINLNPMTTIINSYRDILLNHTTPNLINLGSVLIVSLMILLVVIFIFNKLEKKFVEEL